MRVAVLAFALFSPCCVFAAERQERPRICAEDLPEGVHLSALPACRPVTAPKRDRQEFRDLGNGVSVRVGGRVSAEYGVSR